MEENTVKTLVNDYSFRAAYDKLPKKKAAEVRKKLKKILGIKSDFGIWNRIVGNSEPKVSEAKAIEKLFRSYGIEIQWGETPE